MLHRRFILQFLTKKSHVTSADEFTSSKYFYIYYFNYYNITIRENEMPFLFLKFLLIFRHRILEQLKETPSQHSVSAGRLYELKIGVVQINR